MFIMFKHYLLNSSSVIFQLNINLVKIYKVFEQNWIVFSSEIRCKFHETMKLSVWMWNVINQIYRTEKWFFYFLLLLIKLFFLLLSFSIPIWGETTSILIWQPISPFRIKTKFLHLKKICIFRCYFQIGFKDEKQIVLFLPLKLILHSFFTILFWFILFRVKYFLL